MEEHGKHGKLVGKRAPEPGRIAPGRVPPGAFASRKVLPGVLALALAFASAPISVIILPPLGGGHAFAAEGTRVAEVPALDADRLEAAGLDDTVRLMIGAAFARAADESAAIDAGAGGDPSADPRDIERAQRRVRDELLDTVGVYNYVAGRHASFAPNRLSVAEAPEGGTAEQSGLRAGDVLVAVDGWRVFDLDDIALLDAGDVRLESAERNPDADEREYALELLRHGRPLTLTVSVPPDRFALIGESVAPADWAD